jgi:glycosyltransferase involved in cell wall biosynthesis
LLTTVRSLHNKGWNCHVLLPEKGPLGEELSAIGATVQIFELGILRRRYGTPLGVLNRFANLGVAIVRVLSLVFTKNTDLVYTNTTAVFAGAIVSRLARKPHLWHVHEIISSPTWLAKSISWSVRNLSDSVVAVSDSVRRNIERFSNEPTDHIEVIYNGIDTTPFDSAPEDGLRAELGIPRDGLIVGMVWRVHFWKGQGYFLRIAAAVARDFPEVRFVMVGDAFPGYEYLYERIRVLKAELNLEDVVIDLGFRSDIPRVLDMLDVFVLPSIQPDPFPTVVLEAMAASLPVIATSHGGAQEMILDGVTGFLIPWDDEVAAARIMSPLIRDRLLRAEMGRKGRMRLDKEFSLESYQSKIVQEVQSLVKLRQRGSRS